MRGLPEHASQTRAVWSSLAVTTRAPSGLNAAAVTMARCSRGSVRGLPERASQGDPAPAAFARSYPPIAAAADVVVDAVLAAVAGFFTARALEPPPPGPPPLRPFQAAQAEVARAWLAERLHLG